MEMWFRYKISLIFLVILIIIPSSVFAPCTAFWPPDRSLTMDNSLKWLAVYDEISKKESIVIELEFRGDAQDFAILFASPDRPDLNEVDQLIFQELRSITPRPPPFFGPVPLFQSSLFASEGITIVEVKDVADFTATVLTADSAEALTKWLDQSGYAYSPQSVKAFEYYVQTPGFHFIALKINTKEAACLENKNPSDLQRLQWSANPPLSEKEKEIVDTLLKGEKLSGCNLRGKLKPFEVKFTSQKPILYTRIMGQNAKPMDIELYTIGKVPYYVPGTIVHYSQRLSSGDLKAAPSIEDFASPGDWVTRATLKMEFEGIDKDISLLPGTSELSIGPDDRPRIVNPDLTEPGNGVVKGHGYRELNFEQADEIQIDSFGLFIFQLSDSLTSVTNSISFIFPFFAALGSYPPLFLIFLFPIFLGLLWPRRKAAWVTTVGTAIGITISGFFAIVMFSSSLNSPLYAPSFLSIIFATMLILPVFLFSLAPATIFGVVAYFSSYFFRKMQFFELQQNKFNRLPEKWCYAAVAGIIIITVSLFGLLGGQFSGEHSVTLFLAYLASYIIVSVTMNNNILKYRVVNTEVKKDDWKIAAGLFLAFLITQLLWTGFYLGLGSSVMGF